jgi:hypothetical protein
VRSRPRHAALDGGFDGSAGRREAGRLESGLQGNRTSAAGDDDRRHRPQPNQALRRDAEGERERSQEERGLGANPASIGEQDPTRLSDDQER